MKEYIKASLHDLDAIFDIVQSSIRKTYPRYYPKEVVDFFCDLHSKERIQEDIQAGMVGILLVDGECVGTGCYKDDHITRVYVKPECQGKGYGSYIMDRLEESISDNYPKAELDASLPACHLYETRGYKTIKHGKHLVENDVVLVYEVMEKTLED